MSDPTSLWATAYFRRDTDCGSSTLTVDGTIGRLLEDRGFLVLVSPRHSFRSTSDDFLRFHEGVQGGNLPGPADWLDLNEQAA